MNDRPSIEFLINKKTLENKKININQLLHLLFIVYDNLFLIISIYNL